MQIRNYKTMRSLDYHNGQQPRVESNKQQETMTRFHAVMEKAAELAAAVELQEEKIRRQRSAIYALTVILFGFGALLLSVLTH